MLMATDRAFEDAVHTTSRGSLAPLPSTVGSRYGSAPYLERTVSRATTMGEKINEIYLQLPLFAQNEAKIEKSVQTLAQTVRAQTTKITNIEQILGASWLELPFWKQVHPLAPAASTRQDLGMCSDTVTAPQPLGLSGPMAQGHLMTERNTRRRLDTFSSPEDEHARSAVLLQFDCDQYHTGVTNWINSEAKSNMPAYDKPVRLHCKTDPCQSDTYSKQEQNVRTLWSKIKMMVSPTKLIVHFAQAEPISLSAGTSRLKTGKRLAPLWQIVAAKLKVLFPEGDDTGTFIVPAPDVSTGSQHQGS